MRSIFLLFLLLALSVNVSAQDKVKPAPAKTRQWYANIFFLNPEMRYERDSSQQMVDRRPFNFAAGARKGSSTFLFEYDSFSETSGNNTLSIDREHKEYSFWWRENLMNMEFVDFFMTVGLGAYQEKVTTKLLASSSVDSSSLQVMGGGSAGAQSKFAKYFLASIEARLLAGKNFDPNPQASLLVRLGVEF